MTVQRPGTILLLFGLLLSLARRSEAFATEVAAEATSELCPDGVLSEPFGGSDVFRGVIATIAEGQVKQFCAPVYPPYVPEGIHPTRLTFAWYDASDRNCGALRVIVDPVDGPPRQRDSGGYWANGTLVYLSRFGTFDRPELTAPGTYVITAMGGPTTCNRYIIAWSWSGTSCGNGRIDAGEVCDDGNTLSGDCCSSTCQLLSGQADGDADGICDAADNCPVNYNPDQRNADGSSGGDLCDTCPADAADGCSAAKTAAATIDEDGGTLTVPDQSASLYFPPDTLAAPSSVSATGPLANSSFGLKLGDKTPLGFELEPSGATFHPPVRVTLRWQDANDNCFVDNPAKSPCTAESRTQCATDPTPCDLPVREESLQIFRNGAPYPLDKPGTTCGSDFAGCDREANEWTIAVSEFSEYVLGEATCAAVRKRRLTLGALGQPRGDETLRFRGQFNVDVPVEPVIDPIVSGISLVVETAKGEVLYAERIDGGAYDETSGRGWKKRPNREVWTYASGAAKGVTAAKGERRGGERAARQVRRDDAGAQARDAEGQALAAHSAPAPRRALW
jgi:cysteine-rich repeat protein